MTERTTKTGTTVDVLKLHEITPFLINHYFRENKLYRYGYSNDTVVELKLTRMPSMSAMDLTQDLLKVFTEYDFFIYSGRYNSAIVSLEESAILVYDLCSKVIAAETLGEDKIDLSDLFTRYDFHTTFLDKFIENSKAFTITEGVPNDFGLSPAVKRYVLLEFK